MAQRRRTSASNTINRKPAPRRDWSKLILYTISILVVLSMLLGSIASFFQ